MMNKPIVVYDACVLYPAPLRDLLMHLAITDLYNAKWSNQIHEEWITSVLTQRKDLNRTQLERTKKLMNENVLDSLVENFEHRIPDLKLPDKNDNHVLAVAIESSASVIVTYNLRDFPSKYLISHNVEAQHPDDFISHWFSSHPGIICSTIKTIRASLKNPPKTATEYLNILERQSLPKTVMKMRDFIELI